MLGMPLTTAALAFSVHQIRTDVTLATGFILVVDGKEYMVTAGHVMNDTRLLSKDEPLAIEIFHDSRWKPMSATVIGHNLDPWDVGVFALSQALSTDTPLKPSRMVGHGQEVRLLGYPLGLTGKAGTETQGFHMPFVRQGIVANVSPEELMVIDAAGNQGMSGGPVVYPVFEQGRRLPDWFVAGVIGSIVTAREKVLRGDGDTPTGDTVFVGTGLTYACPIHMATNMIKAHPFGFPVPERVA